MWWTNIFVGLIYLFWGVELHSRNLGELNVGVGEFRFCDFDKDLADAISFLFILILNFYPIKFGIVLK